MTNLTDAHKNVDEWRETVQLMVDRGAEVPTDKIDILVNYLAKNFCPKDSAPAGAAPPQSAVIQHRSCRAILRARLIIEKLEKSVNSGIACAACVSMRRF